MKQEQIERLSRLCAAPGVNGQREALQVLVKELQPLCDQVETDALGNVIGRLSAADPQAPVLILEAHLDQIGFVVTGVDEKGFVRVAPCGGVDRRTLPAAEVVVYGDRPYAGVFGSVPPHLSKENTLPDISEMGVDIGLSASEAKVAVKPGDRVLFRPVFVRLGEHRVSAPALDDRAGCEAVLEALEQLRQEPGRFTVTAVFSSREEVGGQGAATAAFGVHPNVALCTDVSFAQTPDADPALCGVLGGGTMIGFSPLLSSALSGRLTALSEMHGVTAQPEVMGGSTGTDADRVTVARTGVPTGLLSIPLRYMHTPVETVDLRDIEATATLMAAFAREGEVPVC